MAAVAASVLALVVVMDRGRTSLREPPGCLSVPVLCTSVGLGGGELGESAALATRRAKSSN